MSKEKFILAWGALGSSWGINKAMAKSMPIANIHGTLTTEK